MSYESLESVAAFRELHAALGRQFDVVLEDARTPEEAVQGALFLLRVLAMSTEVVADGNPRAPFFARMDTPGRKVGGDNPDAEYDARAHRRRRAWHVDPDTGRPVFHPCAPVHR